MLAIPIVFSLPTGGGGVEEVIAAIVSSALLLIGVGIWIRAMHRSARPGGTTIELPFRTETKAA